MKKLAMVPETEIHSLEELAEIKEDAKILLHHISKVGGFLERNHTTAHIRRAEFCRNWRIDR